MPGRRAVLRWGSAATLGLALPAGTAVAAGTRPRRHPPAVAPSPSPPAAGQPPRAFTVALPRPTVLSPLSTDGGVDRYEIRQTQGRQQILPGRDTTVWGYNGTYPGPTIEARRGRPVAVTHHNELAVPTVVHLHGAVVAAESDGYPSDYVLPAGTQAADPHLVEHARRGVAGLATGSRTYLYPNDQPAATLWYHDHRMDFSGPQIYRGLAGFYLIRDDAEAGLGLPQGDRDLSLMIADRSFTEDGSLFYPARDPTLKVPGVTAEYHHDGMIGDTIAVNGVAWPFHEIDATLHRLRIVNASNARIYQLELDPPPPGGKPFIQIGSDVGLLPRPVRHDSFIISPGERYDMLVDFAAYKPGTKVLLRNRKADGATSFVMRFDVARAGRETARVPASLAPDTGPAIPANAPSDRRFSLFIGPAGVRGPSMINLRVFDLARIDARPTLGSTEIWDVTADPSHPVHLHLAHFRVLSRDGGPPAAQDAGWKDTVYVPQGGVRLAVTFTGHRGKYVFHCHNLEHGDAGMMANMEIV